jgi:malate dehydrogenase (oxaloacetate-decarboxylating)
MKDYGKLSIEEHKKNKGQWKMGSKFPITNRDELSVAYSPGVAAPSLLIAQNKHEAQNLTSMKSAIAVITDGSAVLGLGNIGPEAALPVMEGKAALFKHFAGLDAVPIVLGTQNVEEIIAAIIAIAPTFGGINLEDISAPRCFEIEERLKNALSIPLMHDDQHGTAIVVLAGLINALKVRGKNKENAKIVVNGAGAAGIATTKLLHLYGFKNILICDSKGIIHKNRTDLGKEKIEIFKITNINNTEGTLKDALIDADIFIGVSKGNVLTAPDIKSMNEGPIVFAMANPIPEITPEEALAGGVGIFATGRSDLPNQINNSLAFPGIFRGAIDGRVLQITDEMKLAAASALADLVQNPSVEKIIPGPFDEGVMNAVANAVIKFAKH